MAAPRFVLIDHSIAGEGGHYLEYARHVLAAARDAGLQPVLAANRAFRAELAPEWQSEPVYELDAWGHRQHDAALHTTSPARSAGRVAIRLAAYLERASPALGELFRGRREAAWRVESKRRAGAFCRDTAALAKRLELRQGDLVFLPNLSLPDVLALARYFRSNNESAGPSWHLLFRRDARYTEDDRRDPLTASGRIRASLKELCASLAGQRVGLYTDTDRLTAQYNGLEVATFSTLCIPVNPAIGPNPNRSLDRPLQIAYLGDARREKGYQLLPDLVEELRDRYLAAGRIRFLIQSNLPRGVADPVILRARTSLRNHDPSHVQLIETPLDPSDYEHAMAESDVIVLPYDPERYQARSSGVFAEALSAAIPVLVPEGTWMSAQLSSSRANDVQETRGVAYARDPGSFLSNLLDGYDTYKRWAQLRRVWWRECHRPEALVSALTEQGER